jgi:hypothetical protein
MLVHSQGHPSVGDSALLREEPDISLVRRENIPRREGLLVDGGGSSLRHSQPHCLLRFEVHRPGRTVATYSESSCIDYTQPCHGWRIP